jgi:hypothetical protein
LTVVFDTTRAGASNGGHLGEAFSGGFDWRKSPRALEDLLSYLKTL